MKLAALDLGSNSFHLLVADIDGPDEFRKLGSQKEVLRLGTVVREHGRLTPEAFETALCSVERMVATASRLGAEKLSIVATSALRDARNGEQFSRACHERFGVDVEMLSGDDEARLAFMGARSAFGSTGGRVAVADIGGGSVELASGDGLVCNTVRSLPLGFLRLGRAFPVCDVASSRRLGRYVQLECEKVVRELGHCDTLLLSGGTARSLGKLLGGGVATASATQVIRLCEEVARQCTSDLLFAGVEPERAVTLPVGAAVIAGVIAGLGQWQVRISPRGLREGVMLRDLARRAHRAA